MTRIRPTIPPPLASSPDVEKKIQACLTQAQQRCMAQGAKLTQLRERIYELLLRREGSSKAYDLLADMQTTDRNVVAMTVYRALDFLVAQGLVHKVASNNSFVVCHHDHHPHSDPVFMVCERCGDTREWDDPHLVQNLSQALTTSGFQVHGMEIKGECARCHESTN
jgi:Fur family transcriptional regulator, zinc uptake regulator